MSFLWGITLGCIATGESDRSLNDLIPGININKYGVDLYPFLALK
jgi:hypothetical protein